MSAVSPRRLWAGDRPAPEGCGNTVVTDRKAQGGAERVMWLVWLVVEDGVWRPGIGDPTFMGWLTVVVYFVTAYMCHRCFKRLRRVRPRAPEPVVMWWLGLTVALSALGVNKQLDLQSLVTTVGRSIAQSQGWYEDRRAVQFVFVALIGLLGVGTTAGILWALRRWLQQLAHGIIGFGLLCAFVVIRAASFHLVDGLLGAEILGLRFNWIMELGALALIARAAAKAGGVPPSWRIPGVPKLLSKPRARTGRTGREEVPIQIKVRATPPGQKRKPRKRS